VRSKACSSNHCGFFQCRFSLAYTTASYGCCCSYCSYNTRVEKEERVATTQEHNKPASKGNPRKIYENQLD
jgi:hypothetical protein